MFFSVKRSLVFFIALALMIVPVSCDGKSEPDQIAFSNDGSIYVMNADGSNLRQLTTGGLDDGNPSWSPDGEKIAFERYVDGSPFPYLHVMDADGSNLRQVMFGPENWSQEPAWSPNGEQIAFHKYTTKEIRNNPVSEIFVIDADGTDLRQLTNTQLPFDGTNSSPTWSPGGEQVAYGSSKWFEDDAIVILDADGTDTRQVVAHKGIYPSPNWSPDGKKIAFIDYRDGKFGIYVMNADGSDITQLTFNDWDLAPSWSPDSKQIAFMSDRDGDMKIYVMNADGSNVISTNQIGGGPAFKP